MIFFYRERCIFTVKPKELKTLVFTIVNTQHTTSRLRLTIVNNKTQGFKQTR